MCTAYNSEEGLAEFTQRNKMNLGDEIELLSPGKTGEPIEIMGLYDADMNPINSTQHPYMKFYIKTSKAVKPGDIIREK